MVSLDFDLEFGFDLDSLTVDSSVISSSQGIVLDLSVIWLGFDIVRIRLIRLSGLSILASKTTVLPLALSDEQGCVSKVRFDWNQDLIIGLSLGSSVKLLDLKFDLDSTTTWLGFKYTFLFVSAAQVRFNWNQDLIVELGSELGLDSNTERLGFRLTFLLVSFAEGPPALADKLFKHPLSIQRFPRLKSEENWQTEDLPWA